MQNFIELLKDHTLILSHANALLEIVGRADPAPDAACDALRRLARLLEAHLRAEDAFIHMEREAGTCDFELLCGSHGSGFDAFVTDWTSFLQRWDAQAAGADWPAFGADMRHILGRLRAQVELENRSLYPAALKHGLARLLPEEARETAPPPAAARARLYG